MPLIMTLLKEKSFMHTEKFIIDSSYIVTEKRENVITETITIHVSEMWQNKTDRTWRNGAIGHVSIGYKII